MNMEIVDEKVDSPMQKLVYATKKNQKKIWVTQRLVEFTMLLFVMIVAIVVFGLFYLFNELDARGRENKKLGEAVSGLKDMLEKNGKAMSSFEANGQSGKAMAVSPEMTTRLDNLQVRIEATQQEVRKALEKNEKMIGELNAGLKNSQQAYAAGLQQSQESIKKIQQANNVQELTAKLQSMQTGMNSIQNETRKALEDMRKELQNSQQATQAKVEGLQKPGQAPADPALVQRLEALQGKLVAAQVDMRQMAEQSAKTIADLQAGFKASQQSTTAGMQEYEERINKIEQSSGEMARLNQSIQAIEQNLKSKSLDGADQKKYNSMLEDLIRTLESMNQRMKNLEVKVPSGAATEKGKSAAVPATKGGKGRPQSTISDITGIEGVVK